MFARSRALLSKNSEGKRENSLSEQQILANSYYTVERGEEKNILKIYYCRVCREPNGW